MILLHVLIPQPAFSHLPLSLLGFLPMTLGAGLALASLRALRASETPSNPTSAPTALVTRGVFGRTRNPMYLGMVLSVFGAAVVLGSVSALVVALAYVLYVRWVFVLPEERRLDDAFGDAYRAYAARVRRWI